MADEATKAGVIGHSPERIPPSPPYKNNVHPTDVRYFYFMIVMKDSNAEERRMGRMK